MLGDVKGYAIIKQCATSISNVPIESFKGYPVRVLEFAPDGGVLVVNSEASGLAMFDKEDIHSKFECGEFNDFLIPPNLNDMMNKIHYISSVLIHKENQPGFRDMNLIKKLIICQSLSQGKFTDTLYFQFAT